MTKIIRSLKDVPCKTLTGVNTNEKDLGVNNSCRYCQMGMGIMKVTEGNTSYYLCQKHYNEGKDRIQSESIITKDAEDGKI